MTRQPHGNSWGFRVLEDHGFSWVTIGGRFRPIVDIKPLDDWNRIMPTPNECIVCHADLAKGVHDLVAHQEEMQSRVDDREFQGMRVDPDHPGLNASIKRHPAGSRLPGVHRAE